MRNTENVRAAAAALGLQVLLMTAKSEGELETTFTAMAQQEVGGLLIGAGVGVAYGRLVALAASHSIPTMSNTREYAVAGGLMSYGASRADAWRQGGI